MIEFYKQLSLISILITANSFTVFPSKINEKLVATQASLNQVKKEEIIARGIILGLPIAMGSCTTYFMKGPRTIKILAGLGAATITFVGECYAASLVYDPL